MSLLDIIQRNWDDAFNILRNIRRIEDNADALEDVVMKANGEVKAAANPEQKGVALE